MFSVIQAASPIASLCDGTLQHDVGLRSDKDWACFHFLVADFFLLALPVVHRSPHCISLIKINWFLLSIPLQWIQMKWKNTNGADLYTVYITKPLNHPWHLKPSFASYYTIGAVLQPGDKKLSADNTIYQDCSLCIYVLHYYVTGNNYIIVESYISYCFLFVILAPSGGSIKKSPFSHSHLSLYLRVRPEVTLNNYFPPFCCFFFLTVYDWGWSNVMLAIYTHYQKWNEN